MSVRFGLQQPSFTFPARPDANVFDVAREIAYTAEAGGFDSFWLMDHLFQIDVVAPEIDPILDCWTALAAVAGVTSHLRLGTLVTCVGFRPPSVLAKIAASLDVISHGRLIMGIGAGWCDWEHKAYGLPFPPVGERLRRLEEAIQVLKVMWTQERATFEGQYYQVQNAICAPKPVQKPHPPILVGGSGAKVTLRITAQYAQAHNIGGGPPESCRQVLQTLRGHCEALGTDYDGMIRTRLTQMVIGRSESDVQEQLERLRPAGMSAKSFAARTLAGTPDQLVAQLRPFIEVGVNYFIISFRNAEEIKPIRLFAEEVIPRLQE